MSPPTRPSPLLGPPFSVQKWEGFHCGVVGCCEGKQVEHRRWHGIGSASVVYTVRPCAERTLVFTLRTGIFPPSVTWLEERDKKPHGVDLSWFQQRGPGDEDYVSTSSGLDAEAFYETLQAEHGCVLVPDETVLDALLADASTRWPSELLAASPALARTPVSARGSWLSSAWFRFAALFLAFGAMCACAPSPARKVGAAWQPMDPPRAGLRCWYSYYPGQGVAYCEPDPTATFGASP